MNKTNQKPYESPKMEVMDIEPEGMLCTSDGGSRLTGDGFQFGTSDGQW